MVNIKFERVTITIVVLLVSHVVHADDSFCYRNENSNLLCFRSMEDIPELHRPNAFFRPSAVVKNITKVPTVDTLPNSEDLLPPAKSFEEEVEINAPSVPKENDNQPKLEIFVAKWCSHCKALEKFLIDRGVKYKKYDVETDEYASKVYEQEGSIPISFIKGKTILGFDPRKYGEILDAELPY